MTQLRDAIEKLVTSPYLKNRDENYFLGIESGVKNNPEIIVDLRKSPHTLVSGKKGSGKTTSLISQIAIHSRALVIGKGFIINGSKTREFEDIENFTRFPVANVGAEGKDLKNVKAILDKVNDIYTDYMDKRNRLQTAIGSKGGTENISNSKAFNDYIKNDKSLKQEYKDLLFIGRTYLFINDIQGIFSKGFKGKMSEEEKSVLESLSNILHKGAVAGISVVITTENPDELPASIRSNLTNHADCLISREGTHIQVHKNLHSHGVDSTATMPILTKPFRLGE